MRREARPRVMALCVMPAPAGSTEASLPIGQPIPAWNFVLIPEDGAFRLIILSDNISSGYINSVRHNSGRLRCSEGRPLAAPGVTSGRTLTLSHYSFFWKLWKLGNQLINSF